MSIAASPNNAVNAPDANAVPLSQDAKTMGVVSVAHALSHFFHLILAPLFPWLKDDFQVSYVQLGLLMTVFFVVSGVGQAMAGFLVDKVGPRPVLLYAVAGFVLSALVLSAAPNYWVLMLGVAIAGAANSVFHPVDFSILNARISAPRLGYAFTAHGLSGNLGWAAATAFLAGLAALLGWRTALQGAAGLAACVWVMLWFSRRHIDVAVSFASSKAGGKDAGKTANTAAASGNTNTKDSATAESPFAFLALPNVWLCFGFFALATMALSTFQTFGSTLLKNQYGFSAGIASQIVTLYLVCGAAGMVLGGWLVVRIPRNDQQIAAAYGLSALGAFCIAMNWLPAPLALGVIALMGFSYGLAGPSRDMLIKKSTPKGATGRVYGVVYSGADAGFAVGPVICGWLIDHQWSSAVFFALCVFQLLAIACAYTVGSQQGKGAGA
jgi:MFS transporter, FSR family, fosmidomycin resistance protein